MITSLPLPGTTVTSHSRIVPPYVVYARPFVRPISSVSPALFERYFGTPRYCGTFFAATRYFFSLLASPSLSTWRATLRHTLPISRSSERTPDSLV